VVAKVRNFWSPHWSKGTIEIRGFWGLIVVFVVYYIR
jgi:hypothetical protein